MTFPTMPEPSWLDPGAVLAWLRVDPVSTEDGQSMADVCAAVELVVQRCRPDAYVAGVDPDVDPPVWTPTADILIGARMFAARVWRRRLTPSGVEAFTDAVSFVATYDPEVQRFLREGPYRVPRVG